MSMFNFFPEEVAYYKLQFEIEELEKSNKKLEETKKEFEDIIAEEVSARNMFEKALYDIDKDLWHKTRIDVLNKLLYEKNKGKWDDGVAEEMPYTDKYPGNLHVSGSITEEEYLTRLNQRIKTIGEK